MKHTIETIEKAFYNHVKRKDVISASKLRAKIVGCKKELREELATKIANHLAKHANYCYSLAYSGTCQCVDVEDLASEVQKVLDKEVLGSSGAEKGAH